MRFGSLQYLYLLWILPAMILVAIYSFRKKRQMLRRLADPVLWDRLAPELHRRRQTARFLLLMGGVALLVMALLRPRWGFHWEEIKRKGVDILVAVDVSESMLAEDIKPNRLERAKREITDLVAMLQGDRIGLIAFAGTAFLECPLTLDYGAFKIFLDYLDTELIPVPGTAIGAAIRTAIRSFGTGRRASKALILITDGEDHMGDPEKVAEVAKARGIRIFTIGVGSPEGVPIPVPGGKGDFKRDRNGQMVLTRLHEATLQKVALMTGGSYIRSVSGDMDLKKIYEEEIRGRMEAGELQSTRRRRWEERFQWFLFGSILLFTLEGLLPERKHRPRRDRTGARLRLWRRAALFLFLCVGPAVVSTPSAHAESIYAKIRKAEKAYENKAYDEALKGFLDAQVERPDDLILKYDIGNAHYRMRNFPEAEEAFQSVAASGAPGLAQKAFYNLGNCAYRQGKLEEAVMFYRKALELDPDDEDARFNLEFVRQEIKRRLNEAMKRQQTQEGARQAQPKPGSAVEGKGEGEAHERGEHEQRPEEQPSPEQTSPEGPTRPNQALQGPSPPRQAGPARRMSPEEAARWLNTLDEEQKDLARKQVRKALGRRTYIPEKDW